MKNAIHPEYFPKSKITCACGATYTVGSTMPEISVELCAACHPFYTGTQKILDTARRVEKFKERGTKKQVAVRTRTVKKQERAAKRKPKFEMEVTKSARIRKSA
ncbi:50S ribosomal protein L31 [Candidatus Uhrbacteria bacterium]|nr:50S ribosomal protein L31 [Candidatus Uhrbacteria bacterium]